MTSWWLDKPPAVSLWSASSGMSLSGFPLRLSVRRSEATLRDFIFLGSYRSD
jgi:hypothetical protein